MGFRYLQMSAIVILTLLFLPGCSLANGSAKFKRMEEVSRALAKEKNQEIIIYGKVVDFDGNPINEAIVNMSIRIFGARKPQSSFKDVVVKTDNDGLFCALGFGELISLDDIKKDGYVYSFKYNRDRSRWSLSEMNKNKSGSNQENPITFRVIKKAPPSFVLTGSWQFGLRDGGSKLLDLYRRDWTSPELLSGKKFNYRDWETDVRVSVEKNGENFQVILEAVKDDSGFVVATPEFIEEMTEAPVQGYRPKIVIPVIKKSGGRLFAYVKNEGGLFYSKIYINYANRADRDYVELDWGYFTNVEGKRGLPFAPEIAQQYRDDAKARRRPWLKREQLRDGNVAMLVLGAE